MTIYDVPDIVWAVAACAIFCAVMFIMFRIDCAKVDRAEARFRADFPDCCYPNADHPAHHKHYRDIDAPNPNCNAEPPSTVRFGVSWCCKCSFKLSQRPELYPAERINA